MRYYIIDNDNHLKMGESVKKTDVAKQRILRCVDWLQKQNNEESTKLSLQNKNDIQFIIQTNAARKNFLLAAAEDEATVPTGVDENPIEPKSVSLHKLRVQNLNMECEWQSCRMFFSDYTIYQEHVHSHVSDVHVIEQETGVEFVCLWDVCGHKTSDFAEMTRHMNYHAYHGKLLAIGFNARSTLKLVRCKKDSTKRNQLPVQGSDYRCMWYGCDEKFNSMQAFLDHVKLHTNYAEKFVCSWAGCGAVFPKKMMLVVHIRSHTGERLIACYHCGQHFALNRKLCDHVKRQNVHQNSPYVCELCGARFATEYMLGEHMRQHVSTYACTLCDMSATSPAALAHHVRYRHLSGKHSRPHACPHCPYKAVTKWDLQQHIPTHKKKKKDSEGSISSDKDVSDDENSETKKKPKKKKSVKQYACHMCPEKEMKVFSRGTRLTTHLVKEHGAQWSFGHSRFRYQLCEDGKYRLTTTRFESLEVSTKIVDGYTGPKELLNNFEYNLKLVAQATKTTPRRYEVTLKNAKDEDDSKMDTDSDYPEDKKVEITMCNVDEKGNIISSEVIKSELMYS